MSEYGVVTDGGKVIAISKVVDGSTVSPMFLPAGDCTYEDCLDMAQALISNSQIKKEAGEQRLTKQSAKSLSLNSVSKMLCNLGFCKSMAEGRRLIMTSHI